MLNYSDVQTLREKGQTNRQILEVMSNGVPSARKALADIDADTQTPDWMKDAKIGKMLDTRVPKNAPSGMGYAMAMGLNQAQKKFNEASQPLNFVDRANQSMVDYKKNKEPGFLNRVGGRIENAWGDVLNRTEEYHQGKRGLFDTVLPNAASLFSGAVSPVTEGVSTVVGGALEATGANDAIGAGARAVAESPFGQKVGDIYQKAEQVAPNEMDTLKTVGKAAFDAADVIGAGAVSGAVTKGLKEGGEKALQKGAQIAQTFEKNFDEVVREGIDKGAKPQFRGAMRGSPVAQKEYYQKASQAVRNIIDESPNLQYVDESGDVISAGHAPRNLNEFLQAIPQVKKNIFERYSAATAEATGKGATVEVADLVEKLIEYADDPVKQIADKSKTDYALKMAEQLMKQKQFTPVQAESLIKELNQSLARAYEGKAAKGISEVDMSIANFLRENLDNVVVNSTDENYQGLKNAYGALKAIEKDVAHQALKVARGNSKSLTDLTDIFTGGDIVLGAVSGNPALVLKGLAGKGIQMYYKKLVSPDANIMRMFNGAQKALRRSTVESSLAPLALP